MNYYFKIFLEKFSKQWNSLKTNVSMFKNSFILFRGLFVVQLINIGLLFIYPKLYKPQDFATFGLFTSAVLIISEIINLKINVAVMLAHTEQELQELVQSAIKIACVVSALSLLIIMPYAYFSNWIYLLLPVSFLIWGIYQPIFVYFNHKSAYSFLKDIRITQGIAAGIFTILFGTFFKSGNGLVIGYLAGISITTSVLLWFYSPQKLFIKSDRKFREVISTYKSFYTFGTLSSLLNSLSRNSVVYFLDFFFSKAIVGQFTFANRLLGIPVGIYSEAIGQIYYKEATIASPIEVRKKTKSIMFLGTIIGIIPCVVIMLWGEQIFNFLFSPEWKTAGIMASYLVMWHLAGMIIAPVTCLLDIKFKLAQEFYFSVSILFLRVITLIICGYFFEIKTTMLLFTIVGICFNAVLGYYILRLTNAKY